MTKRFAWEISPKNSIIQFKAKWFGISSISGQFLKFYATVEADDLFTDPQITLSIDVNSIESPDPKWNEAFKQSTFLADELHPFIEFTSESGCIRSSGKIWELTGDLSIKRVKKEITMIVNNSDIKREKKKMTAVFHFFGSIMRSDFGVSCEQDNDVSDEIQLNAVITLIRIDE